MISTNQIDLLWKRRMSAQIFKTKFNKTFSEFYFDILGYTLNFMNEWGSL